MQRALRTFQATKFKAELEAVHAVGMGFFTRVFVVCRCRDLVNLVRMLVAQCILQVGKIRRWFDAHGLDTLPEWQENTLTPDLEGMQQPRLIVASAETPM